MATHQGLNFLLFNYILSSPPQPRSLVPLNSLFFAASTISTVLLITFIIIVIVIIIVAMSPLHLVLVIRILAFALLFKILPMRIGQDFRKGSCAAGICALAERAECACDGSRAGC